MAMDRRTEMLLKRYIEHMTERGTLASDIYDELIGYFSEAELTYVMPHVFSEVILGTRPARVTKTDDGCIIKQDGKTVILSWDTVHEISDISDEKDISIFVDDFMDGNRIAEEHELEAGEEIEVTEKLVKELMENHRGVTAASAWECLEIILEWLGNENDEGEKNAT